MGYFKYTWLWILIKHPQNSLIISMFYWLEVKRKVLYMRLQEISLCLHRPLKAPVLIYIGST